MMAMFGWTDPKMPAHYIAQANREKLGFTGMDKMIAFDATQTDGVIGGPLSEHKDRTSAGNEVVTFPRNIGKKAQR